jgi:hypothetical protein
MLNQAAAPRLAEMAADQLTALDATFLELEEADQSAHMHIGAAITFEPGEAPAPDVVAADLDARLDALPRYRHRLSTRHTGGLSWPSWKEIPDLDLAAHVGRARGQAQRRRPPPSGGSPTTAAEPSANAGSARPLRVARGSKPAHSRFLDSSHSAA